MSHPRINHLSPGDTGWRYTLGGAPLRTHHSWLFNQKGKGLDGLPVTRRPQEGSSRLRHGRHSGLVQLDCRYWPMAHREHLMGRTSWKEMGGTDCADDTSVFCRGLATGTPQAPMTQCPRLLVLLPRGAHKYTVLPQSCATMYGSRVKTVLLPPSTSYVNLDFAPRPKIQTDDIS
jgi:hypothetical protein